MSSDYLASPDKVSSGRVMDEGVMYYLQNEIVTSSVLRMGDGRSRLNVASFLMKLFQGE